MIQQTESSTCVSIFIHRCLVSNKEPRMGSFNHSRAPPPCFGTLGLLSTARVFRSLSASLSHSSAPVSLPFTCGGGGRRHKLKMIIENAALVITDICHPEKNWIWKKNRVRGARLRHLPPSQCLTSTVSDFDHPWIPAWPFNPSPSFNLFSFIFVLHFNWASTLLASYSLLYNSLFSNFFHS